MTANFKTKACPPFKNEALYLYFTTMLGKKQFDTVIIGAGAAGLMCAAGVGQRGRRVLLLDHAPGPGKKILISGGGHCNFTNRSVAPTHFISQNPHFCKSALSRFGSADFIKLVEKYNIPYQEKKHGQLFCKRSARDILHLLLEECRKGDVEVKNTCAVDEISHDEKREMSFTLKTNLGVFKSKSLVIATGGLSFPKIGGTDFGYRVAKQFGLNIQPTQPALVALALDARNLQMIKGLSGISANVSVSCKGTHFLESMLFTHKGLSGPAILQISNYWHPGDEITINFLPDIHLSGLIVKWQKTRPKTTLKNLIAERLTKRLAEKWLALSAENKAVNQYSQKEIEAISDRFHLWQFIPSGTSGYRLAEVTLGGVDTNELSSKTFETKRVPGLYFIGEVVDVTGWLGGYNFQWAWSSGYCAGLYA